MMPTQQLLVRLPEELVRRLRQSVPSRSRSSFVQHLLEQALPADCETSELYRAAIALEADAELTADMAEWDCTVGDGLSADR